MLGIHTTKRYSNGMSDNPNPSNPPLPKLLPGAVYGLPKGRKVRSPELDEWAKYCTRTTRFYFLMEAVGMGVVAAIRANGGDISLEDGTRIKDAFWAVTESWLYDKLLAGETCFVRIEDGKPILSGPKGDNDIDVRRIYMRVCGMHNPWLGSGNVVPTGF